MGRCGCIWRGFLVGILEFLGFGGTWVINDATTSIYIFARFASISGHRNLIGTKDFLTLLFNY